MKHIYEVANHGESMLWVTERFPVVHITAEKLNARDSVPLVAGSAKLLGFADKVEFKTEFSSDVVGVSMLDDVGRRHALVKDITIADL